MEFPNTSELEDMIATEEGIRIFGELRKKYSNNVTRDLDKVLNSLCFALVRFFKLNLMQEDAEIVGQLVKDIIVKNLKK